MSNYLLPSNPLGRGFDPEFSRELDALRQGDATVGSVDHDELVNNSSAVVKLPAYAEGEVEYRGWMVTPEQYGVLDEKVSQKGLSLATSVEQFRTAHHMDGWLDAFQGLTFETVLIPEGDVNEETVAAAAARLGAHKFFVKDYVKSRKDDVDVSVVDGPERLYDAICRFIDAQGDWFAGGVVVRAFHDLPGDRVEVRGWWRNGEWVAVTNHPDYSGSVTPEVPEEVLEDASRRLTSLGLRFVSVDLTVDVNGDWWVIEVGDGQVSGLPADATEVDFERVFVELAK